MLNSLDSGVSDLDPKDLASIWNVGTDTVQMMILKTMRLCPSNFSDVSCTRIHNTNHCMKWCCHLPMHTFYSDKLSTFPQMNRKICRDFHVLSNICDISNGYKSIINV